MSPFRFTRNTVSFSVQVETSSRERARRIANAARRMALRAVRKERLKADAIDATPYVEVGESAHGTWYVSLEFDAQVRLAVKADVYADVCKAVPAFMKRHNVPRSRQFFAII